jgi:hypothetical protein
MVVDIFAVLIIIASRNVALIVAKAVSIVLGDVLQVGNAGHIAHHARGTVFLVDGYASAEFISALRETPRRWIIDSSRRGQIHKIEGDSPW